MNTHSNRPQTATCTAAQSEARPANVPLVVRLYRGVRRRLLGLLNGCRLRVDQSLARWAARSTFLSGIYYAFVSRSFRRENQACLQGRLRYSRDVVSPEGNSTLLRRNIHRLEKGLLMRPRRSVFGVEYIEDTVSCYERLLNTPAADRGSCGELDWAHDVLSMYFKATEAHPRIDQARLRFQRLSAPSENATGQSVPYTPDFSGAASVSYDQLLKLAKGRHSVRWFLQQPVPREEIDKAVSLAGLSPSACNRQPFVFRILDDRGLVQRVGALSMGTTGYCDNIPVIIAVVGRLRAYFSERDRHLIYIDASLASMALVLALETLGLSSCCLNWPDVEEQELEIANVLKLDGDDRVVMLIALGYPDQTACVAYSQKKPLSQLRGYNDE